MDPDLLSLLVDPETHEPLTLKWVRGAAGQETGLLTAPSGAWYPIVRGVPRIVNGHVRAMVFGTIRDELEAIADDLPGDLADGFRSARKHPGDDSSVVERTAQSFGYEWTTWGTMLPEYEAVARHYFEPFQPLELTGRLVLDAGCGTGRQAYYAHRWGARVVGMDLSEAIDVARMNVPPTNSLFVQADLRKPPFLAGTFDDAVSFGVLHHLPDPESGFRVVVRLARPGGRVLVYVYHAFEGQPVKAAGRVVFDLMRRGTTRLPHRAMKALAHVLGAAFTVAFVAPGRMLRQRRAGRRLAASLPFASYVELPFRVIVNDQFDRFATPIENRYTRADMLSWFERAGLRNVRVMGNGGWRAVGTVAEPRLEDGEAESALRASPSTRPNGQD